MKRPLCFIGFPFACAMFVSFYFNDIGAIVLFAVSFFMGAAFYFFALKQRTDAAIYEEADEDMPAIPQNPFLAFISKRAVKICVILFSAALAFGMYSIYYRINISPFEKAEGSVVTLEGFITSSSYVSRAVNYTVKASFPGTNLPDSLVSVRAYGEAQAAEGDSIRCNVTIKPASGSYYAARKIFAFATVKGEIVHISPTGFDFESVRLKIREYFRHNLHSRLSSGNANIIGTMTMNLDSDIDPEVYYHMRRSGILHLLSISGLHFSALTALVLAVFRALNLRRRVPEIITIILSFLFVILAGFSTPMLRAFIMFLLVMAGQLILRRGDSVNSLAAAVLLLSAIWPSSTQSIGLCLSAFSTLGILLLGQKMSRKLCAVFGRNNEAPGKMQKLAADSIGISVGASLFTLPILILQFGSFSIVSPITNLLITPFVSVSFLGGLVCAVVPGNSVFINLAAYITDISTTAIVKISEFMGQFSFATVSTDEGYILMFLLEILIAAAVIFVFRAAKRYVALGTLLCVLSLFVGMLTYNISVGDTVEFVTLEKCDTVIFIKNKEAVILNSPSRYDFSALSKYLDYRGIKQISHVAAYNITENVDSGIIRLVEKYDVGAVISPDDAYVSALISRAVGDVPVNIISPSPLKVLGGSITLCFDESLDTPYIICGTDRINISFAEYKPVSQTSEIWVYKGGAILLPDDKNPSWEPLGMSIYGETRIILKA